MPTTLTPRPRRRPKFRLERLTARHVRKLRKAIAENRCPEGPGLLHDWRLESIPDWSSWGYTEEYMCTKCGTR